MGEKRASDSGKWLNAKGRRQASKGKPRLPPPEWLCPCFLSCPLKFLIFVGINVGGRPGLSAAFFASGVESVPGVFAGWWLARRLLE